MTRRKKKPSSSTLEGHVGLGAKEATSTTLPGVAAGCPSARPNPDAVDAVVRRLLAYAVPFEIARLVQREGVRRGWQALADLAEVDCEALRLAPDRGGFVCWRAAAVVLLVAGEIDSSAGIHETLEGARRRRFDLDLRSPR